MIRDGGVRAFADDASNEAFARGIKAGIERVLLTGATVDLGAVEDAVTPLAALATGLAARKIDTTLEPHAVALFSEMIATAGAIRIAHGEAPLTQDDIEEFLPAALRFFNTYVGCRNPG